MNVVMRYDLNTYFAKDLAITVCMCANFYNQYRYVLSVILTNNDEHFLSNRSMRETTKALLVVL